MTNDPSTTVSSLGDRSDVERTDLLINRLGSGLLFHPATLAYAAAQGIHDPIVLYAGGRAGVMGDVNSAQVAAAFGFFSPSLIETGWKAVEATGRPSVIAGIYAEAMAAAGRAWFADGDAAAGVAQLGWAIADSVEPLGLSLFAGWRQMRVADDPKGSAAIAITALRELRGGIHVQSVARAGLSALEAEIATRGAEGARAHGWEEPYPLASRVVERMAAADADTAARMNRHYERLSLTEAQTFSAAIERLADAALPS